MPWSEVGGVVVSDAAKTFVVDRVGNVYRLRWNGTVWALHGRPPGSASDWVQIRANADALFAGADGVSATDTRTGDVYMYYGAAELEPIQALRKRLR